MIKNDQKLTFVEEYESFKEGKEVSKSSTISSLSPFMDPSGVIKMKTRLEYCDILPEQARYPVILAHPNKSRLAELLIIEAHLKLCHGGPEVVRRRLRNLYWILGGKKLFLVFCINVLTRSAQDLGLNLLFKIHLHFHLKE